MPTLEETLSDISTEVSQISSDVGDIGAATTTKAGLLKVSSDANPDNDSVPNIQFFKDRNIVGASGEAAGGLPQAQLDQIAALPSEAALAALAALPVSQISALPAEQVLAALSSLPTSLSGLEGQIIAVNSAGNGYEVVVAPSGGGGAPIPVNIIVDHFTGDGSTAAFTLSQSPANSNALDISVGGMAIDPAIYSISGTTLTFDDAPPATDANAIVVRHLGTVAAVGDGSIVTIKIDNRAVTLPKMANGTPGKFIKYNDITGVAEEGDPVVGTVGDDTITTPKIVNKNVTLPKFADGTPGKIIGFNASTGVAEEQDIVVPDNSISALKLINKNVTLAKMADGTPGKFLKYNDITGVIEESDGTAGQAGVWNLIEEQVITSNTNEIAFTTGIDSTYREYRIRGYAIEKAGGSGENIDLQITKNAGASYESSSNYEYVKDEHHAGGGQTHLSGSANTTSIDLGHHEDGATGVLEISFYDPSSTTLEKVFKYSLISARNPNTIWTDGAGMYGKNDSAAINGLKIFYSSGDSFANGRFILEGKN